MARRRSQPSRKATLFAGLVSSLLIVAYGVLLILAGVGALRVDIRLLWHPALIATMGVNSIVVGACRKRLLPVWLGATMLTVAACILIGNFTEHSFRTLYPMFIAAPAVGSLSVLFFTKAKRLNLVSIIFFGGMSVIFALKACALIKTWIFVVGIVVVMIGLIAFVTVATSRKGRWDDGDTVPKPRGKKWDDGDALPPAQEQAAPDAIPPAPEANEEQK